MKIITLEGLPLVGKTSVGVSLCEYFNQNGIKSIYKHGQITENESAKLCVKKAFKSLEKWDYSNKQPLFDFIKYRYEQINIDFYEFKNNYNQFSEIEYLFLDRYITGHNIMARYFGYDKPITCEDKYYELLPREILLVCEFEERKKRALDREKTNKFTKYSIKNNYIHNSLQKDYDDYFQNRCNCQMIFNNKYISAEKMSKVITKNEIYEILKI